MKTKIYSYISLLIVISILAIMNSCKKKIEIQGREKYISLYIPKANNNPNYTNLFMRDEEQAFSLGVYRGGADDADHNIQVRVDFKPELVSAYNTENGTNYPAMPAGSYNLESNEVVIKAGQSGSSTVNVKVKTAGFIEAYVPYLLPVSITNVSDNTPVNDKLSTVFFLISGSYEPGNVPRVKMMDLEGGKMRSIFKYYDNLITHSEAGAMRQYSYLTEEERFESKGVINTGWDIYDLVLPFADRWIVRWGSWTGGNNGFINSYPVAMDGTISPAVSGWFAGGFQAFDLIIPYQGSLLCRLPAGEMRRYPIDQSYNFGTVSSLGTGWQAYTQILPYKNTLLCIDASGNLWEYPVTAEGVVSPRRQVGSGWDIYSRVIAFGDDLLGIDENNAVYQYKFNPVGFWALK